MYMEIFGPWFVTEYKHYSSCTDAIFFLFFSSWGILDITFTLFLPPHEFSRVTLKLMSSCSKIYINLIIDFLFVLRVNRFGDMNWILLWGWWLNHQDPRWFLVYGSNVCLFTLHRPFSRDQMSLWTFWDRTKYQGPFGLNQMSSWTFGEDQLSCKIKL